MVSSIPKLRFPEFTDKWQTKRLGDVTTLFSKRNKTLINAKVYSVTNSRGFVLQTDHFSKVVAADDLKNYKIVKKDDFAYNPARINVGSIARFRDNEGIISSLYVCFRANDNINGIFLEYFIQREGTQFYFNVYGEGGVRIYLWYPLFSLIKIGFPEINEQQKIADFLTTVDKKIESIDNKVELLKQYKRGVMQKIFTQQIRFPEYIDEWEKKRVDQMFKITRGNVLATALTTKNSDARHKYPVYSSQTKKDGLMGYYDQYLYEDAITWTTDGANAGDVKYRPGKFYCTNVCGVLIGKSANNLVAELLNQVTHKYVSYVGNPKLMNNVMGSIVISTPSIEEQQKIADFLSTIDDKIKAEETKLASAKKFKKALLQRMFV